MHHLSPLKQEIKAAALQLGFSHIGVAPAHPVPHYQTYADWVNADHHADMHYLARPDSLAKRADPSLILEGCQRVICLVMPYNPPETPLDQSKPGYGRIAAYARTTDYHLVIEGKLKALETFIHTYAGESVRLKSYVDTGPIIERTFAAQAGIGLPGKNTNLIIPGSGSFFFLAVMLTDWALPPDPPFTRDLCGSCQRCIEACPTGCIQPDRTIDAGRCISYLTIENKGHIPDTLKNQIGEWVFGCDICQMVCPHNTRAQNQTGPLGQLKLPELIDLHKILTWDQYVFSSAHKTTALSRAKLRGLLRNAAVVLGNQRQPSALPLLKNRLNQETDPVIQDAFQWAIEQLEHGTQDKQDNHD